MSYYHFKCSIVLENAVSISGSLQKEGRVDSVFLRGLGFVAVHRLSVVGESRGYSLVIVCGRLTVVASLVVEHGFHVRGLQ